MCNEGCILFVAQQLSREDVAGKRVLELGSGGFGAGSLLESWHPQEYVGVDIAPGPGVDLVCNAEDLPSHFPESSFDVVLSTEMLEHVRDWRRVITGLKNVLRPGGRMVITTRSQGYPFHAAPHDYWRFEVEDMRRIFSDFENVVVAADVQEPGVFVSGDKPLVHSKPAALERIEIFSMVMNRRTESIPLGPVGRIRSLRLVWSGRARQTARIITETLRGRPPGIRFQVDIGHRSPRQKGS